MARSDLLLVGTADGLALYRATSRGLLRQRVALAGAPVSAIAAADAETLLVAAGGAARQSFDGGRSWSDAPGAVPETIGLQVATVRGPAQLAYPRLSGATAYARLRTRPPVLLGAGAGGAMLFRSLDDGIHWQPALLPEAPLGRVVALAPSPARPAAAWAGTDQGALLGTIDGGERWDELAREPAPVLCLAAVVEE
jgi:photosystem II stability/assembly factor-like uncharacterized protein